MRKLSTADLRDREVINLCGGEKLGYPCDFEIDIDSACIISMTVPKQDSLSLFSKKEEYIIPWCKIECIGEDAILVKIQQSDLCCCEETKRRKKFK